MVKKILPTLLIIAGSFLEVYYYAFRFANEGVPIWLSIIIGGALTALLAAVTIKRGTVISALLIISLAVFSIVTTSAGQAFSLNVELIEQAENTVNQANISDELEEISIDIDRLNNEYDSLSEQIAGTITTLENRYEWKNTLKSAEDRQGEITARLSVLKDRRQELRALQTTRADIESIDKNIYTFYSDLFGFDAKWLQFILQTILSGFIALMAPFGIIMVTGKAMPIKTDWVPLVDKWVSSNWISVRAGHETPKLLKKEIFFRQYPRFKKADYKKIKDCARLAKVVDSGDNITYTNEEQIIKRIMIALTVKNIFGGRKKNG